MSNLLHPYSYWLEDGKYLFRTPSNALYAAYFLDLTHFADNLFTFNFDKVKQGDKRIVDKFVFDTICTILIHFFENHRKSILLVCDSSDGREKARKRLFDIWFHRIPTTHLLKIDKTCKTADYDLILSLLMWDDNQARQTLIGWLDEYCEMLLQQDM